MTMPDPLPSRAAIVLPDDVLGFPSMITPDEKTLLYSLARDAYSGRGVIVDAGIFLGGSTKAFASGLSHNASATGALADGKSKPIHAYDTAIWNADGFDKYCDNQLLQQALDGRTYADGESYFPLIETMLSEHLDLIEFTIGDIIEAPDIGHPVEIAFYDCLGTGKRDWAAFGNFGRHYLPGTTYVVQQDYFYEGAIHNKLRQEFLHPYFELVATANTSAAFKLVTALPDDLFETDPVLALDVTEGQQLLTRAAGRAPSPSTRCYVQIALFNFLFERKAFDLAEDALAEIEPASDRLTPRARSLIREARNRLGKVAGEPAHDASPIAGGKRWSLSVVRNGRVKASVDGPAVVQKDVPDGPATSSAIDPNPQLPTTAQLGLTPQMVHEVVTGYPNMSLAHGQRMFDFIVSNRICNVLELGFNWGVSTCYIAAAIAAGGQGRLVSIDLANRVSFDPGIEGFLARLGLSDYCTIFYEYTSYTWRLRDMLRMENPPVFDLVFIDGAHLFEPDALAFILAEKLVRPGGYFIFDDLNWSLSRSATQKDLPEYARMPRDERDTAHVREIFEMLVKPHPHIARTWETSAWGFAQKRNANELQSASNAWALLGTKAQATRAAAIDLHPRKQGLA